MIFYFYVIFSQSFQVSYLERTRKKYSQVIALTPIFPKINSIKSSEWNAIFCMLFPKEFKEKRGQNSADISRQVRKGELHKQRV